MEDLFTLQSLFAFLTLTSLEIVLGIDNVIFIAILSNKLPEKQRDFGRQAGLMAAVVTRLLLLLGISWVITLDEHVLLNIDWIKVHEGGGHGHDESELVPLGLTGKDFILLFGGLFLLGKATWEIVHKVEGAGSHHHGGEGKPSVTLNAMIAQVLMVDIVFSLDSVITAVGMTNNIPVIVAAILVSVGVMLAFSGPLVRFIDKHPALTILALSFLLLIGVLLMAEAFHQHIDKRFIYFAMAFALGVDLLQMRMLQNAKNSKGEHQTEATAEAS